jgi:outer membrane lipoprotein SlyB
MDNKEKTKHAASRPSTTTVVANTALGISGGAALGAAIGTAVAPGIGSALGAMIGGIAGVAAERFYDTRQRSTSPSISSSK